MRQVAGADSVFERGGNMLLAHNRIESLGPVLTCRNNEFFHSKMRWGAACKVGILGMGSGREMYANLVFFVYPFQVCTGPFCKFIAFALLQYALKIAQ